MVYIERKRQAAQDAAEAAGEDVWTEDLDEIVRTKLSGIWEHLLVLQQDRIDVQSAVERMHLIEAGIRWLPSIEAVLRGDDTDLTLSYVEAIGVALRQLIGHRVYITTTHYESWTASVSEVFQAHRLKYKLVNGEVVPLGSEVMHARVIEPTLVLLHGRPEFANAEKAFRDALDEIANGKPDNAVTDAATSLQEALTAVGCKGSALGDLIKDAKRQGLFGHRDSPLAESIAKIHTWVAAERNAGEAHRVSDVSKDDAWFVVHVVGAAIVRLAAGPRTDP